MDHSDSSWLNDLSSEMIGLKVLGCSEVGFTYETFLSLCYFLQLPGPFSGAGGLNPESQYHLWKTATNFALLSKARDIWSEWISSQTMQNVSSYLAHNKPKMQSAA